MVNTDAAIFPGLGMGLICVFSVYQSDKNPRSFIEKRCLTRLRGIQYYHRRPH